MYQRLKEQWPDARVCALVKPQFAAALRGNPAVDEVIVFDGFWRTLARLRREGFTHLLDLHDNLRSNLLRRLAGAPRVSVYRKDALARRLFVAFGRTSPSLQRHTVARYLEALSAWGVSPGAAALSLGQQRQARRPLEGEPARSVLVLQTAFLGDSLLTLPLLREIKEALPGSRLTVLTLEKNSEIFRSSAWVDEVVCDDKRGRHAGPLGLWRLARALRGRGYDLAVVPHRSFRSALLAWLAGIPRRIGFSESAGRLFFTRTVSFAWPMHDLERNLSLALPLKPDLEPRPGAEQYLREDPECARRVEERLGAQALPLVGVHPGSTWETKRWLAERFEELCRRLKGAGLTPVLVGGPQDRDLCARIARSTGALDLCGQTSLGELIALTRKFKLFITNDSGPMHVAAGSGVPTLALFGATTRELGFFPYGSKHRVLEHDLACRPCGLHGGRSCPHGHFLCMRLITVDEVWRNVQEMVPA